MRRARKNPSLFGEYVKTYPVKTRDGSSRMQVSWLTQVDDVPPTALGGRPAYELVRRFSSRGGLETKRIFRKGLAYKTNSIFAADDGALHIPADGAEYNVYASKKPGPKTLGIIGMSGYLAMQELLKKEAAINRRLVTARPNPSTIVPAREDYEPRIARTRITRDTLHWILTDGSIWWLGWEGQKHVLRFGEYPRNAPGWSWNEVKDRVDVPVRGGVGKLTDDQLRVIKYRGYEIFAAMTKRMFELKSKRR